MTALDTLLGEPMALYLASDGRSSVTAIDLVVDAGMKVW